MIRLDDQDQGSESWLQWRAGGIGSSDAAAIMGQSPWSSREELLAHKIKYRFGHQRTSNVNKNSAMMRGTLKEPEVRDWYCRRSGKILVPACGIHDEFDWMRASLDGITEDNSLILEIKCPKFIDHCSALEGTVPQHYWPQVQHELAVVGKTATKLHYVSWSDNRRLTEDERFAVVTVKPNPQYLEELIEAERLFWEELTAARQKAGGYFPKKRQDSA